MKKYTYTSKRNKKCTTLFKYKLTTTDILKFHGTFPFTRSKQPLYLEFICFPPK